jgi:hypothetical protein
MISEAGGWDMLVGVYGSTNPFTFCSTQGTWGSGWTPYDGQDVFAGPHAHKNVKNGRSGVNSACLLPDGMTTYVATDGSAKAADFRGRVMSVGTLPDGSLAFKNFWPQGGF